MPAETVVHCPIVDGDVYVPIAEPKIRRTVRRVVGDAELWHVDGQPEHYVRLTLGEFYELRMPAGFRLSARTEWQEG